MGLNVTFLKDAIQASISSDAGIMSALKSSQVDSRTGSTRDVVFESEPNFVGVVPCVTFTILDVEPLVKSNPTTGVFKSPVILFGVGSNQEESNYLGDLLQSFFVEVPSGEKNGIWFRDESTLPSFTLNEVVSGFKSNPNIVIKTEKIDEKGHKIILSREESLEKISQAKYVVEGANLVRNEYGNRLFADFFFFITGFHGFHVLSGVVINIIIFFNVLIGTYERRGHYEMVEKVGLYWHFVDLVWVFVFTFFYLV